MMKLSDFLYELPPERIAQNPVTPRDHSKLMVLSRTGGDIQHRQFLDITEFLKPGDLLVVNATKVFPARLRGRKKTGGKVDVLLVAPEGEHWRALVRGAARPTELHFEGELSARMIERDAEGQWRLIFSKNHLRQYLDEHGEMPLPPYIKRTEREPTDIGRYQTIYAETEGAVAAPTAGFHFTPELLETIRSKGVEVKALTLHVGWGTFRPIRTESVEKHQMLPESYVVPEETAGALNRARREKRRIIAVGTTTVRTLESVLDAQGVFREGPGSTNLYIYPGYRFKAVDALVTNFHLPDSTPLLLACAFYSHPHPLSPSPSTMEKGKNPSPYLRERASMSRVRVDSPFSLRFAYAEAIQKDYRFYSYGDAMFIP